MNQCCKMFLVPEDVIQTWRAEQREKAVDRPSETVTSTLDANMTHLLEEPALNDYDKEKLYSQELAKFITMRKQQQMQQQQQNLQMLAQPPATGTSTRTSTGHESGEESILASIPKMYRNKAVGLLQYLKADPNVTWDDDGQMVIGGTTYTGSHVIDLINDALRQRKKVSRPTGWRVLSSHLLKRNVPRELVGNREWLKAASTSSSSSYEKATPSRPPTTPKTPKRFRTTVDFLRSTIKKPSRHPKKDMSPTFHTPSITSWEDVSE